MDRAGGARVRRLAPGAAARRRDDSLEARLTHPAFEPYRRWLERLADPLDASLDELNALAAEAAIRVRSGERVAFVPPSAERGGYGDYEMRVFASGRVETRPGNLHDLFNALAWLAFPRTKAALNALHVQEIPREAGRRGRFRDLLTIFDEGGAIVACDDASLEQLVHEMKWKELFWERRGGLAAMRVHVLGHAVLERALAPWPGITCKALFVSTAGDPDSLAAAWLEGLAGDATPRALPPFPVFGLPGWHPDARNAAFYDDLRYFRPSRPRREA